jgi:hypothetical protein
MMRWALDWPALDVTADENSVCLFADLRQLHAPRKIVIGLGIVIRWR